MRGVARNSGRSLNGFTLVEILVAFAVAVVALGALYDIYATGLRSTTGSEKYGNAILLAESGLDALTAGPLIPIDTTDRIGGYERRISVRPRPDFASTPTRLAVFPYEVEVQVAWREGVRERAVSLSTVRLGPSAGGAP
jgi:prepilin-type N-terminal cleavage/methylation domain-containing protein